MSRGLVLPKYDDKLKLNKWPKNGIKRPMYKEPQFSGDYFIYLLIHSYTKGEEGSNCAGQSTWKNWDNPKSFLNYIRMELTP